ncbi:MAG TPA: hypothetical protein VMT52_12510 [Planctomycetota bacterium]|nr:hypothetical protein [Planctomycetota bacterium]
MSALLPFFAALILGAEEPGAKPAEDLLRPHDLRCITEPAPQFPVEQSPRLAGVTLDLVAPPEGPAVHSSDFAGSLWAMDEESAGLAPGAEKLRSLILEEADGDAVAKMLAGLRAERARRFRIDVVLVPPEALSAAPQGGEEALDRGQLEAVVHRAGKAALRLSLVASNEQTVHVSTGRHRRSHTSDGVHQTGVVPVVGIVVESLPLGYTVEARPQAVGSSPFVELALRLWKLGETGKAWKRVGHYSENEVVSLEERSLAASVLLPPGKALLVGSFEDAEPGGKARSFAVLARVEPVGDPGLSPDGRVLLSSSALELRAFDVGFLRRSFWRRSIDAKAIVERVRSEVDPKAWAVARASLLLSGSFLFATAPQSTQRALADWLRVRLAEEMRTVTFDAQVLEGSLDRLIELRRGADRGVYFEPRLFDLEAPKDLERTYRSSWSGLCGELTRFRGVQVRSYVRELIITSGGTSFSIIQMPDEEVCLGGDGFEGEAEAEASSIPGEVSVDLKWVRARTRFERQAVHRLHPLNALQAPYLGGNTGQGTGVLPIGGSVLEEPVPLPIDLPEGDTLRSRLRAALEENRWAIVKLESTTAGQGRMLVARVRTGAPFASEAAVVSAAAAAPPPEPDKLGPPEEGGALSLSTLRNGAAFVEGFDDREQYSAISFRREFAAEWNAAWPAIESRFAAPETPLAAAALRRRLEEHWTRSVTVEVAFVSPDAVEVGAPGSSPWLSEEVFDKACAESQPAAEVAQAGTPMGQRLRLLPRRVRRQVTDQEVQQTGVVPVVQPVVTSLPDGIFVEATAHATPDEALLRVDLRVDRHRLEPMVETRRLPDGDIELASGSSQLFAGCVLVPPRRTVIAGFVRTPGPTGPDGFLLLVRLTPWARNPDPSSPGPVECIDIGAITEPFPRSRALDGLIWRPEDSLSTDPPPGPVSKSVLDEAIQRGESAQGVRCSHVERSVLVGGEPAGARSVRESLSLLARSALRPLVVELWEGEVDDATLEALSKGAATAKEWLEQRRRDGLRVRILCTSGADASIAAFAARAHVSDLNRVTGGTGFSIIEVGDVDVRTAGEGVALDLRCEPVAGQDAIQLSLRGELARKPSFERHSRTRSPRVEGGRPAAKNVPGDSLGWIQIDLPDEDSDRWRHYAPAPYGQPVLLQALPDPAGSGGVRALVAVVSDVKG